MEANNALIAEFMGCRKNKDGTYDVEAFYYSPAYTSSSLYDTCEYTPENMKYASSWEWLMPVVQKIESLPIVDEVNFQWESVSKKYYFNILPAYNNSFPNIYEEGVNKIQVAFNLIIKFINWYNQNKP